MLNEINKQILTNMKLGGDKFKTNVLRLVKAELLNNDKTSAPRKDTDVVRSYLKKLRKATNAFAKRPEKLEELESEIKIVSSLLPDGPSEEYISSIINTVIQNITTAEGEVTLDKHRGRIIGSVKKVSPDVDGSLVAKLVVKKLKEI